MRMFVIGWMAVEIAVRDGDAARSAAYLGLVGLCRAFAGFGVPFVSGGMVERSDRRDLFMLTQRANVLTLLVLSSVVALGLTTVPVLLVASFVTGCIDAFENPATTAMVPRLVRAQDLASAVGAQQAATFGTGIVGPALAGALLGPVGIPGALVAAALWYVPAYGFARSLAPVPPIELRSRPSLTDDVAVVVRRLRRDRVLRWVVLAGAAVALFARPYLNLLPAFVAVQLHAGPDELSRLLAFAAAGSLCGAIAVSLGGHRGTVRSFYISSAFGAALLVALSLQTIPERAWPIAFALGFALVASLALGYVTVQSLAPPEMLGRFMAALAIFSIGLLPLGQLGLGLLASAIGLSGALALSGTIALLVVLLASVRAASASA